MVPIGREATFEISFLTDSMSSANKSTSSVWCEDNEPGADLVLRLFGARVVVVAHGECAVCAIRTLTQEDVGQCRLPGARLSDDHQSWLR